MDECPNGRHCGNFKCKYFHKPSEQRCKNWPRCDKSNCSAIHVDVRKIGMTLIINAADDMSCYGPDDIETGICYSRAIIRSFEGISVPAIIRALRHCRFLKILVVPELDFQVGQFYIMEIINTLDLSLGSKSCTGTKKSRCLETLRHCRAVCQRRRMNLTQVENDLLLQTLEAKKMAQLGD